MRRLLFALGLSVGVLGCGATVTQQGTGNPSHAVVASDGKGALTIPADVPDPNSPWIGAAAGSDAFLPGAQDTFVAVWVDVPEASDKLAAAPAAVALVIDTSGSMAGDKIIHARQSATRLVESLRDGDIVSLHTFSDAAHERVAPTRLDARSRQQIAGVIAELRAEGSTNLFEGVRVAGMAALSSPATHAIKRVVLISDGNATVGETSVDRLGMLGEKAADRSVQVTAIGVGLDYNENALNQLAQRSSGRLYHLAESSSMPEMVSAEIALLKSTRAANARVSIVPAPGVQLLGVDGARGSLQSGGAIEVPLGSMFAGQHREFVVRARLSAPEAGSHPIASVRLAFADPNEGNLERVQEAVARFDIVTDAKVASARKNVKAQGVFAMIDASRTTSLASAAMNADRFEEAQDRLDATEKNLRMQAQHATKKADRNRLEQSAARVSGARAGAARAAAAPKPAQAEMKRKASLDANDAAQDFQGL